MLIDYNIIKQAGGQFLCKIWVRDTVPVHRAVREFPVIVTASYKDWNVCTCCLRLMLLKKVLYRLRFIACELIPDVLWDSEGSTSIPITTYKVIFGLLDVNSNFFVFRDNSVTRGHPYKVMLGHCDNSSQKQFLPHRIANVWNSLPAADTDFTNLISFRASMQNIVVINVRKKIKNVKKRVFYPKNKKRL